MTHKDQPAVNPEDKLSICIIQVYLCSNDTYIFWF